MLDPQLKRGLLDICILAALARGDSYGYKLIRDLSECVTVSESTLYPILRRLEAAGPLPGPSRSALFSAAGRRSGKCTTLFGRKRHDKV